MKNDSYAPTVAKAFDLMAHLETGESQTLAELASATGLAKSSALRILRTLVSIGIVARSNHGGAPSYLLLKRLVPNQIPSHLNLRLLLDILSELAADCAVSAEWFVPSDDGLILAHHAEPPDNVIHVRAREGFCFRWGYELDAITALGYAFFADAPPDGPMLTYTDDGVQERVPVERLTERIDKAREAGCDEDPFWNDNGVKRIARVVMAGDEPVGIISTARNNRPNDAERARRIHERMEELARDIEMRCAFALAESVGLPEKTRSDN